MGFRCRWIATRAKLDLVTRRLGFTVRREVHEAVYDTGLWAVELATGWTVVMGDGWDFMDLVARAQAEELSSGGEAVYFYSDDSAMCAEVAVFRHGHCAWSFCRDADQGIRALQGDPPPLAAEVIAACDAESAAEPPDEDGHRVDYLYEAAPRIALGLVGFRHDQSLSHGGHFPIYELAPSGPPAAPVGFWKRLFGRG